MGNEAHFQSFINESEDLLKNVYENIASLSGGVDNSEAIGEIFRIVHTIKGNAYFFALSDLKAVSSALEDILSAIRSKSLKVEKPVIDLLWNGLNIVMFYIGQMKDGQVSLDSSLAVEVFVSEVGKLLAKSGDAQPQVISSNYRIMDTVGYLCGQVDITRQIYIVKAFIENAKAKNLDNQMNERFISVLNDLSQVFLNNGSESASGTAKKMAADFQTLINDDGQIDNNLLGMLERDFNKMQDSIKQVDIRDVVEERREIRPLAEKIKPSFRVEKEKIDEILEMIYKLVSFKDEFGRLRDRISSGDAGSGVVLDFQKNLNSYNFILRDMMQMIIKIKVTSPRLLLEKMEQIVLALAQSCSKKIKINTLGKDIFVERSKIEVLEKILPHIIRNCIDHGIESPQERAILGKPEEGVISIEASKKGDSLVINITDDGKGINLKFIEKNIDSAQNNTDDKTGNDGKAYSSNIFAPGATTRDSVSELSGRGVGMDMVLRTLEQVGGEIKIFSEINKGTRFVIILPNASVAGH